MAYARRRTRRIYRRRPTRKVSAPVKRYVKRTLNTASETKYYDIAINGTASSTTMYAVNLLNIGTGNGAGQRIGNKIRVLGFRWFLEKTPGDETNVGRILFLRSNTGASAASTLAISTLLGPVDTRLCKVYKDIISQTIFQEVDSDEFAALKKMYKGYIRINANATWQAGGVSLPIKYNYVLQFHSDSAIIPNPGIVGWVRVYFKDL